MKTNTFGSPTPTLSLLPGAVDALDTARRSLVGYGVLGTAALATVVAVAMTGHATSTFMWVRALLLPLVALLLYRLTGSAARGSRRSFERLGALTVVLPIAVIGVDLVPGVCPPWYAAMQAVCMVPVLHVAVLTRGRALREAFPRAS